MDLTTRKSLTQTLSRLTVEIAAALRVPMRTRGPAQDLAQALHREEQVGDGFDLWTDLLSRRAAVLWVLKSLYVRILEDRGLLQPRRILDAEDELFRHLAPNLGPTAYLRWVYRDLASLRGGIPELFAPQPAELAQVPDALSQRLIDFWRSKNPDTGALLYRFDDEHFDSRLMGDLYQDLDPVVKKRYALLQTPDFILDFILEETLTPAITEWGVENVRVLDPACGSGHFLLAAFKRLVQGVREKFPATSLREVVEDVLARVVGIDLNDYACGLARARLVMTALETCAHNDLAAAASFHPRVFWADALEQVERGEQLGFAAIASDHRASMGLLTPPEARTALRPELKKRFHVVVGNPPYITENDAKRREYQMHAVGGSRRYLSAVGQYSLGGVFIERMLQVAFDGGYLGVITGDGFMRRDYGKPLVEQVLADHDLQKVISAPGMRLEGHGTPTIIVFARRRRPVSSVVRVVAGKRGDAGSQLDAADAPLWLSVLQGHANPGFENEYIASSDVPRVILSKHEWTISGESGIDAVAACMERNSAQRLRDVAEHIGFGLIVGEDEAFIRPQWWSCPGVRTIPVISGDGVRDWFASPDARLVMPRRELELYFDDDLGVKNHLWPYRSTLEARVVSGSTTMRQAGKPWADFRRLSTAKYATRPGICFSRKSTHNHFALVDCGKALLNQTAPIIKLPALTSDGVLPTLLAQLNSSSACLWLKKFCQNTGGPGGGKRSAFDYEDFYEVLSGKVEPFPIALTSDVVLKAFSDELSRLGAARANRSVQSILAATAERGIGALRSALVDRRAQDLADLQRMVALQEEVDWLCYAAYGLTETAIAKTEPRDVAPIAPGWRAFEILLGQKSEPLASDEEHAMTPQALSGWLERQGWTPCGGVDDLPEEERRIVRARVDEIASNEHIALLEQPLYKRRWNRPNYEEDERLAMELWVDDRMEQWARNRRALFSGAQMGAAFRSDPSVLSVGELLVGRSDFDVDALIEARLRLAAVPNIKHHVFKLDGLLKRAEWEKSWEQQHKEDGGEPAKPEVPPKYTDKDYLRKEYWSLRGKLDVPKERFVAFTEVPPPVGAEILYGWTGWTARERAKELLGLDERLEAAGVDVSDRHGLLYGVWFLLPYVARESVDAARDFRADVRSLVGENGVTDAMLDEWAKRFPPPRAGRSTTSTTSPGLKKAKRVKAKKDVES